MADDFDPAAVHGPAWVAMQDAKQAAADALLAWRDAEAAFFACPVWQARARRVLRPEPCDCHGPQIVTAYVAYQAATAEVPKAIARFKSTRFEPVS